MPGLLRVNDLGLPGRSAGERAWSSSRLNPATGSHAFARRAGHARRCGGLAEPLITCHCFESGDHDGLRAAATVDLGFCLARSVLTLADIPFLSALQGQTSRPPPGLRPGASAIT